MTPSNAQSSRSGSSSSQKKNEEEKQTPEEISQEAVDKAPEPKANEPTYSHERLIRECSVAVGHSPDTIAGALEGVSEKELTIKQAKAACKQWLKAEQR